MDDTCSTLADVSPETIKNLGNKVTEALEKHPELIHVFEAIRLSVESDKPIPENLKADVAGVREALLTQLALTGMDVCPGLYSDAGMIGLFQTPIFKEEIEKIESAITKNRQVR